VLDLVGGCATPPHRRALGRPVHAAAGGLPDRSFTLPLAFAWWTARSHRRPGGRVVGWS